MKRRYGGVEVDLGEVVLIVDPWRKLPAFHEITYREEDGRAVGPLARCRAVEPVYGSEAALPVRHALRFARPCRRCWPELRGLASLLDARLDVAGLAR